MFGGLLIHAENIKQYQTAVQDMMDEVLGDYEGIGELMDEDEDFPTHYKPKDKREFRQWCENIIERSCRRVRWHNTNDKCAVACFYMGEKEVTLEELRQKYARQIEAANHNM